MVESQKLPEYNMDTMPLRRGHILILMIASAGQFFGGALAILVGVIAPLIAMTHHPGLSPWLQGFIFACGLIGIMLGSLFFLTSSLRTPKFFVKEFSYFLMPCHQHGLRINLLVQR